ncbi:MAG: hypothetical protein K2O11_05975 [Oscillospiraceae bacterium]|nr:hypothetical protein [Oscillospiraceae bacterium]
MAKYMLVDDHKLVEKVEAFRKKYNLPTFEAALRLLYKDKRLMRDFMESKE